jgi:hypothetical protein
VFNELLESALAGPDRALATELITQPSSALRQVVDLDSVAALAGRLGSGGAPRTLSLDAWRIASAELWLRHSADPATTARRLAAYVPMEASFAVMRPGASDAG